MLEWNVIPVDLINNAHLLNFTYDARTRITRAHAVILDKMTNNAGNAINVHCCHILIWVINTVRQLYPQQ